MLNPVLKEKCYPIPDNEAERLSKLYELRVLDTPGNPSLDAVVNAARNLLGVPIVLISLLDYDRQWFKASCGVDTDETPRELAFCNYTVAEGRPFEVEDARRHPELMSNPLVSGDPRIRFYFGVPLAMSEGLFAGSLCVMDLVPRRLSPAEKAGLEYLGQVASSLLVQHRTAATMARLSSTVAEQTAVVQSQSELLHNQKRVLDSASELIGMGAWELNLETGEYHWSDGMYALHEVERDFVPSEPSVEQYYPTRDWRRLCRLISQSSAKGEGYTFEGRMVTAKGRRRWVRISAQVESRDGVPIRRFGVKLDVTDEKLSIDKIKRLAERDGLTGLHNRASFQQRLAQISNRGKKFSVLLIDLDGFKNINDTHGHPAGDDCLKKIARRLGSIRGRGQFIARTGGDEFAVIIEGKGGKRGARKLGSLLLGMLAEPIKWKRNTFHIGASIGVSSHPAGDSRDVNDTVREADLALYRAKAGGRNRMCFFAPEMMAEADHRSRTLDAIRRALTRHELLLHYQAKVSLADGSHQGFEALLRWRKPDGAMVAPPAFKVALDDPQLSVEIGDFVISTALDQAATWKAAGCAFGHIAINLGAHQFRDLGFGTTLLNQIRDRSLDIDMIEVEVTEDVFLSSGSENVLAICRELRAAGMKISFDDFGTGFASLSHLQEFPMTTIKIDRSFVAGVTSSKGSRGIVKSICDLARNFSMDVVAEGIETQEQLEFLRSVGCSHAQGYLFHRPAAPADIHVEPSRLSICSRLAT